MSSIYKKEKNSASHECCSKVIDELHDIKLLGHIGS
jgi:hypothetical protein